MSYSLVWRDQKAKFIYALVYGIWCMEYFGIWHGMLWCGTVQYFMVCYAMVYYGMVNRYVIYTIFAAGQNGICNGDL